MESDDNDPLAAGLLLARSWQATVVLGAVSGEHGGSRTSPGADESRRDLTHHSEITPHTKDGSHEQWRK